MDHGKLNDKTEAQDTLIIRITLPIFITSILTVLKPF
jgi:hypothetical protein